MKRVFLILLFFLIHPFDPTCLMLAHAAEPAGINHLKALREKPLREFLEDHLSKYWSLSHLPCERIPRILNILTAYSDEPEFALQQVQELFPDLTVKNSVFYRLYQQARLAKFQTLSQILVPYIRGKVIVDIGGEDTKLVDAIIKLNPTVERAYVTDINVPDKKPSDPKVEFLYQPQPYSTPLLENSVDTVIMSTVLHHIDVPVRLKLLLHVSGILKENGRVILIEDSFPEDPCADDYKTILGNRYLSLNREQQNDILTFLDWWGNRLLKNSRDIPLPCVFRTMEEWIALFEELGLETVEKQYMGMPEIHTHVLAPKALFVFQKKSHKDKKPAEKSKLLARRTHTIKRADSNMEVGAFVPRSGVQINLSIGGSKIQTAAIGSDGAEIVRLEEFSWRRHLNDSNTERRLSVEEKREWFLNGILCQIAEAIDKLPLSNGKLNQVEGVGIAWPGPVNPNGLTVGPNIQGFGIGDLSREEREQGGIDLKGILTQKIHEHFGVRDWKIQLLNDCDAAAIASINEASREDGFHITIGTGIGSGIIKDGQALYSINGFQERMGEIGHHIVYHPEQNRYFYYGSLTKGKILEHLTPVSFSERLSGPGIARKFVSRLKRECGHDEEKIHAYLNSCESSGGISFSEVELACCDENKDFGPIMEKKILKLATHLACLGDRGALSFINEIGYEIGLGIGVFFKEFESEKFIDHITLSGSVGECFGKGLQNTEGEDLFLAKIIKGIEWSMANHGRERNAQLLQNLDPSIRLTTYFSSENTAERAL